MDAVILQGADHLEAGAVAYVRKPGIFVPAEVALKYPAVFRAVKERAPGFEFTYAIGRFFRVYFSHPRMIQVLAAAHRIREVDAPIVAIIDITHGGRNSAFGHHGVRLAE